MIRLLSSTDPALSPLEQEVIQAPSALDLRTLPSDEQRLLEATLEVLAEGKGAPDAILAGFEEELTELQCGSAWPPLPHTAEGLDA